jgi:hypothetical protein
LFFALRKVTAILIILSLFSHSLFQIGLVAWYQQNKAYVTAKYCVNKDKPKLNCCGKCYLQKQMKKIGPDSGTPTKQGNSKAVHEECAVYILPAHLAPHISSYNNAIEHLATQIGGYSFLHTISVFHPPQQHTYIA